MAKFSATAAALFCFFTLSLAAITPLNKPENDDVSTVVSLPLPDANPTITSNPRSKSTPTKTLPMSSAVPLNMFRPFSRRFSNFPCHHRHKFYKADPMRPIEIPFGDDMLVSSGENGDFQDPGALHGGSWQRVKLHHRRHHHNHRDEDSDSDSDDEDDRTKKIELKRRHFGGLDAEKKLKILKKHFRNENAEFEHHYKKERDGFMNRVRRFFYHYF